MTEGGFLDSFRGDGPLRHLTILDFTQMVMGPIATQLLGDLGALVIKVEPRRGEWERSFLPRGRRFEGESAYFLAMNRNKLSLTADLKDPGDHELVLALAERCDVVVNNFRPGVMERLGLGFASFRERNPQIVFAQGTGYGDAGPLAGQPGQDLLVQALSGLAANTGGGNGPPIPTAAAICDASTGFLLAFSIVAAALDARLTGTARSIEVSLLAGALLLQAPEAFLALNTDMEWKRSVANIGAPWFGAPYGLYRTADGWLAIAMTPRHKLVELFGLSGALLELDEDAWYERRDDVNADLAEVLLGRTSDDWLAYFAEHDVWAAPLLSLAEAVRHPQVEANGFVETIPLGEGRASAEAVGLVTQMSGLAQAARLPPPQLGEHNDVIRDALGVKESTPHQ
jgi:crotonobetainyl-CoA:carnitine CoA-transferase CaiB-like acyl-CoA transferase